MISAELAGVVRVVVATIRTARIRYVSEHELQAGLAQVLAIAGLDVQEEVRLNDRDRIDLLVQRDDLAPRVGVEVKVAGAPRDVDRQLARYAESPMVDALVLVTNRARHRPPATLAGKPVATVFLGAGL